MLNYLVIVFFLLMSFALHAEEQKDIRSILDKIPTKDKENLEEFFRHLIINETFGYVIFGSKPMTIDCLYSKRPILLRRQPKTFIYNPIWNDYMIWKQYQHLFPIKNYIFRIFKSPNDYSGYNYEIVLINKKTCLKAINDNISLFKKKLGDSITAEELLCQLETKEDVLKEILNNNEGLLGILLGFGRHNSQLFQERIELYKAGKYSPPYTKIKESFQSRLTPFSHSDNILNFIKLPYFVVDEEHPETNQIRQEYIQTQKKLCRLYSEGRFLEVTLSALIQ